jgi:hypothetical protein
MAKLIKSSICFSIAVNLVSWQILPSIAQQATVAPGSTGTGSASTAPHSVLITADNSSSLSNLQVDSKQNVFIDFGSLGNQGLNLSGYINNLGHIYGFSSNPHVTNAHLTANNVTNGANALITTSLPTGILAQNSIFNTAPMVSNLSLSITALNSLVNMGQITSTGNLAITAGNTITNS